MLRVVFMGTPAFAVPALEKIAQFHTVLAVYTQPDRPVGRGWSFQAPPVKQKAVLLGLPVFQPEKLTDPGEWERLFALQPDVIVVVAYGQILKKNVLQLPVLGCVNIHSSLLPRWRGAAPIQHALLAGDSETGVTTVCMSEKLDAGEILLQARTPIHSQETTPSLHDRLSILGADLILETLEKWVAKTLQPSPQDEAHVTYASKLSKEMQWLDASSATKLDCQVRALNPWPGTSIRIQGERLKIKKARPDLKLAGPIGCLFEHFGSLYLGTQQGALELSVVQAEGKKEVAGSVFLQTLKARGWTLPLKFEESHKI